MNRYIWAVMGAGALWAGGQGVYTSITNPDPTSLTCAELYEAGTEANWLHVRDCEIGWDDLSYIETLTGRIDKVLIPLLPPQFEGRPKLIISSDEDALRKQMRVLQRLGESGTQQQIDTYMAGDGASLTGLQEFEGLAEFGFTKLEDSDRKRLEDVIPNLAPDYVLLKHGEKPNAARSRFVFVIGLFFALPLLKYAFRRKSGPEKI